MFEHIRKLVLSASVIVLFALYSLQRHGQSASDSAIAALVTTVTPARSAPTRVIAPAKTPTALAQTRNRPPGAPAVTATVGARSIPPVATRAPAVDLATETPTPSGQYLDGTYTGDVTDANWGNVQVEVAISGGQISDVRFLEFPNHRNRSKEINSRAIPILTQEAIAAQSAEVDIVTGATDTSEAFIESLDSALRQAGA